MNPPGPTSSTRPPCIWSALPEKADSPAKTDPPDANGARNWRPELAALLVAVAVALVVLWLVAPGDSRCLVRQGEPVERQIQWITGLKC